ncbi:hypothetical protein OJ997_31620 [Solirubrobacter phytolaccae]|uniref:Uncharacterized protein n=1 Tax=Solirubrobacter phytolaccae TaxID=1404360 RepID=A0A9X3SEI6_9ACTN|nr:hypothetical protein [Solirubrobacter phytolaccae]MDA0184895.1 hypothetical protein [Solirubrobacter phytolaccae]
MRRLLFPAALAAGAILPCTASAEIVKAPTGETSSLTVAASQAKTFKKHKLKFSASGSAKASGNKLTMPYSLSRWDFGTREGDVAYYAKNTGFKLKRGKRTATAVHPRLVLDTPKSGYVSMLIANERIKFFTVSGVATKAADSGNVQQTTGYKLKLTQAGANYVNRALKKKVLKRFSQFGTLDVRLIQPAATGGGGAGGGGGGTPGTPGSTNPGTPGQGDNPGGTVSVNPGFIDLLPGGGILGPLLPENGIDLDGDGKPDLTVLPLEGVDVDLGTGAGGSPTGTIKLGGGLILDVPGLGTQVALVNPEIVLGTDAGLYANVNGVRVKVGDIDTDKLDLNVADGTVTIKDLDVTVGGGLNNLLGPVLGNLVPAGTPLLSLDLSFPEL